MSLNANLLERAWGLFGRFGERARRLVNDPKKVEEILDQARRKAGKSSSAEGWFEYLFLMIRLVTAYFQGRYRQVSYDTIILIVAGILYFLFPLDVLPDPIYLDDAAVLIFVANKVKGELDRFSDWERSNTVKAA